MYFSKKCLGPEESSPAYLYCCSMVLETPLARECWNNSVWGVRPGQVPCLLLQESSVTCFQGLPGGRPGCSVGGCGSGLQFQREVHSLNPELVLGSSSTRPTLVHQRSVMFTEQEAGSSHGRCYVVKTCCLRPRWRGAATRWRLNVRLGRSFMAAVTKERFVCTRRWKGILFANLWRRAKQIAEGLELKKTGKTLGKGHSGLARGAIMQSPSLSAWPFILGYEQGGTVMAKPPLESWQIILVHLDFK